MKKGIVELCFSFLSITTVLGLSSGCSTSYLSGPYSTSEISRELDRVRTKIPIYIPKPDSPFSTFTPIFYYYDDGSTADLRTFFMDQDKKVRIAKMRTATTPPPLDGAIAETQGATVEWANAQSTRICNFTPMTIYRDSMSGDPYQTCIVWWSDNYTFLFYSTLSLDETLTLVNTLERIR